MKLDLEFLRRHYAAMSDEELLATNRDDLTEAAREIFEQEVQAREAEQTEQPVTLEEESEPEIEWEGDWREDSAEAYSRFVGRTTAPAPEAAHAQEVLEAAKIPTQLELFEEGEEDGEPQYRWRVLVPGKLVHRAISVLDRDIFNVEFESDWRTHLEMLSDDELRVMEPHYAFCGLYDRIERVNRAYTEELQRRGLAG